MHLVKVGQATVFTAEKEAVITSKLTLRAGFGIPFEFVDVNIVIKSLTSTTMLFLSLKMENTVE